MSWLPRPLQRFAAAMIVALGLMVAQPAISSNQLFRVGQAAITATDDDHRRVVSSDEPPPAPGQQRWFIPYEWTTSDLTAGPVIAALARGDPSPEAAFRAGWLLGKPLIASS